MEVHWDRCTARIPTKESRLSEKVNNWKEVIPMEKRKEYAEGEIIDCPRCGSDDLDCDEAPNKAKCLTCGLEFTVRQVAVWEE
jgi:hypothetical protein